jgi:glutaredoxin
MSEESRITIYKTEYCGYCKMAAGLLDARGIPYQEIMVDDAETRMKLIEETGWRTVPIIMLDDELIGGYDDLVALDRSGALQERLG